ncbi:hypothetical protein XENOCAPTIV_013504, partial [Xenoophorus captivus]
TLPGCFQDGFLCFQCFIEMSTSSEALKAAEELQSKPTYISGTRLIGILSEKFSGLTNGSESVSFLNSVVKSATNQKAAQPRCVHCPSGILLQEQSSFVLSSIKLDRNFVSKAEDRRTSLNFFWIYRTMKSVGTILSPTLLHVGVIGRENRLVGVDISRGWSLSLSVLIGRCVHLLLQNRRAARGPLTLRTVLKVLHIFQFKTLACQARTNDPVGFLFLGILQPSFRTTGLE